MPRSQDSSGRFVAIPLSVGTRYGECVAIRQIGTRGHNSEWECECDCGETFRALGSNLRSGNTKSCGCRRRRISTEKATRHGMSETSLYWVWSNILRRCNDPKNPAYRNYGGRGIRVCDRWMTFENFRDDVGVSDGVLTLDRIANDGNYEPSNCRWASRKVQARNKRSTKMLTIGGITAPVAEWAELYAIPLSTMHARINKLGWTGWKLLSPLRAMKRPEKINT